LPLAAWPVPFPDNPIRPAPRRGPVWEITVELPIGSQTEYVYNRGGWDRIERQASCGQTEPRQVTIGGEAMTLDDTVVEWHDLDGCG